MNAILIQTENYSFKAKLYDTPTGNQIYNALPLEGDATLWGEEIYFATSLNLELENDAREIVEPGELAFWPMGSALCIFFGITPASTTDKPQAYSPVNVFGKLEDDLSLLKNVNQGEHIIIKRA